MPYPRTKVPTEKQTLLRVRRGAKLLDKKVPGWFKKIKLRKLDMAMPTGCIMGQLFGFYFSPAVLALQSSEDRVHCGFAQMDYVYDENTLANEDAEYALLTKLWKNEVRVRKAPPAVRA